MRILQIHNYYQIRGGEDAVVDAEREMLEKRGNTVIPHYVHSDEVKQYGFLQKLLFPFRAIYNNSQVKIINNLINKENIDIVHIHNFWPIISPSILLYFNRRRIPYTQTVHNFRYIVPDALLYKEDIACRENNFSKLTIKPRSIRAYRNSVLLTSLYRLAAYLIRRTNLINHGSGRLILLNKLALDVHKHFFHEHKLCIKGNFFSDAHRLPEPAFNQNNSDVPYYLFLGRLSKEKGLATLIKAFSKHKQDKRYPSILKIAGSGEMLDLLKKSYGHLDYIKFMPFTSGAEKTRLIKQAKALILPSECHENFPVSIMEANYCGVPVIASHMGGIPDMIENGKTGILFETGSISDLENKVRWCDNHPRELKAMGKAARKYALKHFSEEKNYLRLMQIYKEVIEETTQDTK